MSLPIIISLTTIPPRFNQTAKNIEFLLQNLNKIGSGEDIIVILNCPMFYKRFSDNISGRNELRKLKKYKQFVLQENINDDGPITKIIPTLHFINSFHKKFIIVICDDEKYHIDAFKKIIDYQNKNISVVHSYWVYNYPKNISLVEQIHVPQGVDMISVCSDYMNDFINYNKSVINSGSDCILVDDLVLGYYFKKKGMLVKQIERDWKWPWIPTQMGTPSLFNLKGDSSRDTLMKKCYNYLK